jgi:acetolactate synthase-1/3 small subunit
MIDKKITSDTLENPVDKPRRHTLAIRVDNRPGVLARVITLISGRGFNIDSLSVAQTMDPEISIITLIITGSPKIVSQIIKQLRKLINVVKVTDLSLTDYLERQLIIVRVKAEEESIRSEIMRLCEIFRAKVVDVSLRHYTLEITGSSEKIKACLNLLKAFGIEEQVSTGLTAMSRSTVPNPSIKNLKTTKSLKDVFSESED